MPEYNSAFIVHMFTFNYITGYLCGKGSVNKNSCEF